MWHYQWDSKDTNPKLARKPRWKEGVKERKFTSMETLRTLDSWCWPRISWTELSLKTSSAAVQWLRCCGTAAPKTQSRVLHPKTPCKLQDGRKIKNYFRNPSLQMHAIITRRLHKINHFIFFFFLSLSGLQKGRTAGCMSKRSLQIHSLEAFSGIRCLNIYYSKKKTS